MAVNILNATGGSGVKIAISFIENCLASSKDYGTTYIVIHDGISVNKPHENAVRFSVKTGLHFLSFICYLPAVQLPAPSLYLENIQHLFQLVR